MFRFKAGRIYYISAFHLYDYNSGNHLKIANKAWG
jgi:hypothetical protein